MTRFASAFILLSLPLDAALSVAVTAQTQTQAILTIAGYSGACTIRLSTAGDFSIPHPDVDATKYAGSSTDTGRADTITWADGRRLVTLGHMNDDRALAADMTHYVEVSGCGTTATASFKTATLPIGSTTTWPVPTNMAKWGNLGYPDIDYSTKNQTLVDPITGVLLRPLNVGNDWSWRTGCGAGGCWGGYYRFADVAGGSGWTNPLHIVNQATSDASTSNANPIDLYSDVINSAAAIAPWQQYKTLEDVGVVLWSGSADATAAHRQYDICIFKNPVDGCFTNTVRVTAGTSFGHTLSGSTDADQPFPAGWPANNMASWTSDNKHFLRNEDYDTAGTVTCAAGACTIASPNATNQFSLALKPGARIKIAGSSPTCTNNLCTLAVYTNVDNITLAEALTITGAAFHAYGWGIRIKKVDTTSTLTIGAAWKIAGSSSPLGLQSLGDHCGTVQVTSGDGKPGYVCELMSANTGLNYLYFVGNDGTVRGVSFFQAGARMPANPADQPNTGTLYGFRAATRYGFDVTDGKKFHVAMPCSSSWCIYDVTYGGDFTTDYSQAYNYTCGSGSDCLLEALGGPNDQMTWVNATPVSTRKDLISQIATHSEYNAGLYGNSYYSWQWAGCSGGYCYFQNSYDGQGQYGSGGPGWLATIQLSTGTLTNLCHTLDGTGCPGVQFESLHSEIAQDFPANGLFISGDNVNANDTSKVNGGPFRMQLTGVKRAGTFSTNTALPWPVDSSYDNTCPTGNAYESLGAVGNQCVTFEMTQPCNVAPSAAARSALTACPWNAAYTMPVTLAPGMMFREAGKIDYERFKVISVTATTGNKYSVVVQRDAAQGYCCVNDGSHPTRDCSSGQAQAQHSSGWIPEMSPGMSNSCEGSSFIRDSVSGNIVEIPRKLLGHFDLGNGGAGAINYGTSSYIKYHSTFSGLADPSPASMIDIGGPAFAGVSAQVGSPSGLQSYTRLSNYAQPNSAWELDMNAMFISNECPAVDGCRLLPARTVTHITGDIYQIEPTDYSRDALTPGLYKTFPLSGNAGRYQLREVSGPTASVDATPYSFCYALHNGECHAGSVAGKTYANIPYMKDPQGYCTAGMSWMNIPCITFGYSAPMGGIRQQRISAPDSNGAHSRFLSYQYSAPLRSYVFAHSNSHPSGLWALAGGVNFVDGKLPIGFAVSIPAWTESNTPVNDFVDYPVAVVAGPALARVRYGYSRNIGANAAASTFACTNRRGDACTTATASGQPFTFESEAGTATSCASGCTITIKTHQPNLMYYQVVRSGDGGSTWSADLADPNIHAVALGSPLSSSVPVASGIGTSITGGTVQGARIQ